MLCVVHMSRFTENSVPRYETPEQWFQNEDAGRHDNTFCPYASNNDSDDDGICDDVDSCSNDVENDADADLVCGDVDVCPHDAMDDVPITLHIDELLVP